MVTESIKNPGSGQPADFADHGQAKRKKACGIPATIVLGLLLVSGCRHSRTTDSIFPAPVPIPAMTVPAENASDVNIPTTLSLHAARKIARQMNPGLAAMTQRVQAAEQTIAQARAAYWPVLSASSAATRVELTPAFPLFEDALFSNGTGAYETYSVTGTLSWVLFDGFLRRSRLLAAKAGKAGASAGAADYRRLLLAGIADTFYGACLAATEEKIAAADMAFNQRLLDDARKRLAQGAIPRAELMNFQIRFDQGRIRRLQAQRDRRVALAALAELMGFSPRVFTAEKVHLIPPKDADKIHLASWTAARKLAWASRPDLQKVRARIARAEANIKIARSAFYPTLSLQGDYGAVNVNQFTFSDDDRSAEVSAALSWTLFSGGHGKAAYEQAKIEAEAARRELQQTWLTIERDLQRLLDRFHTEQETFAIQQKIMRQAIQIRNDVEKEYRAGRASLTRLNEVQRDVITARAAVALAAIRIHMLHEAFLSATGQLPEKN